ncbi:hypothetical protein KRMM14A1259_37960 [Krasilnikovia sp. MM14-A1259]
MGRKENFTARTSRDGWAGTDPAAAGTANSGGMLGNGDLYMDPAYPSSGAVQPQFI